MLVAGFPAGAFAANCYIVAPAPGEECVIIDPGQDAQRGIEELLDRYRLKPIAVLLTHGHVDHMWSVAPVCGAKGIAALACDTDGTDGGTGSPQDPAGAIVDWDTIGRASSLNLVPATFLANNDSTGFFRLTNDLLVCGPTGTNVNDFRAIVVDSMIRD